LISAGLSTFMQGWRRLYLASTRDQARGAPSRSRWRFILPWWVWGIPGYTGRRQDEDGSFAPWRRRGDGPSAPGGLRRGEGCPPEADYRVICPPARRI